MPSPSTSDDDEVVAELYPVYDSCLGLYATDEEDSELEPFQEGSGDGSSGEEDLGEVEDTDDLGEVEDAEGDEGVDYDYDLEPF